MRTAQGVRLQGAVASILRGGALLALADAKPAARVGLIRVRYVHGFNLGFCRAATGGAYVQAPLWETTEETPTL